MSNFQKAKTKAWRHGLKSHKFKTLKYDVFNLVNFGGILADYRIAEDKRGIQKFLIVLQNAMLHTHRFDTLSKKALENPIPRIKCDVNLEFKPIFYHDLISNTTHDGQDSGLVQLSKRVSTDSLQMVRSDGGQGFFDTLKLNLKFLWHRRLLVAQYHPLWSIIALVLFLVCQFGLFTIGMSLGIANQMISMDRISDIVKKPFNLAQHVYNVHCAIHINYCAIHVKFWLRGLWYGLRQMGRVLKQWVINFAMWVCNSSLYATKSTLTRVGLFSFFRYLSRLMQKIIYLCFSFRVLIVMLCLLMILFLLCCCYGCRAIIPQLQNLMQCIFTPLRFICRRVSQGFHRSRFCNRICHPIWHSIVRCANCCFNGCISVCCNGCIVCCSTACQRIHRCLRSIYRCIRTTCIASLIGFRNVLIWSLRWFYFLFMQQFYERNLTPERIIKNTFNIIDSNVTTKTPLGLMQTKMTTFEVDGALPIIHIKNQANLTKWQRNMRRIRKFHHGFAERLSNHGVEGLNTFSDQIHPILLIIAYDSIQYYLNKWIVKNEMEIFPSDKQDILQTASNIFMNLLKLKISPHLAILNELNKPVFEALKKWIFFKITRESNQSHISTRFFEILHIGMNMTINRYIALWIESKSLRACFLGPSVQLFDFFVDFFLRIMPGGTSILQRDWNRNSRHQYGRMIISMIVIWYVAVITAYEQLMWGKYLWAIVKNCGLIHQELLGIARDMRKAWIIDFDATVMPHDWAAISIMLWNPKKNPIELGLAEKLNLTDETKFKCLAGWVILFLEFFAQRFLGPILILYPSSLPNLLKLMINANDLEIQQLKLDRHIANYNWEAYIAVKELHLNMQELTQILRHMQNIRVHGEAFFQNATAVPLSQVWATTRHYVDKLSDISGTIQDIMKLFSFNAQTLTAMWKLFETYMSLLRFFLGNALYYTIQIPSLMVLVSEPLRKILSQWKWMHNLLFGYAIFFSVIYVHALSYRYGVLRETRSAEMQALGQLIAYITWAPDALSLSMTRSKYFNPLYGEWAHHCGYFIEFLFFSLMFMKSKKGGFRYVVLVVSWMQYFIWIGQYCWPRFLQLSVVGHRCCDAKRIAEIHKNVNKKQKLNELLVKSLKTDTISPLAILDDAALNEQLIAHLTAVDEECIANSRLYSAMLTDCNVKKLLTLLDTLPDLAGPDKWLNSLNCNQMDELYLIAHADYYYLSTTIILLWWNVLFSHWVLGNLQCIGHAFMGYIVDTLIDCYGCMTNTYNGARNSYYANQTCCGACKEMSWMSLQWIKAKILQCYKKGVEKIPIFKCCDTTIKSFFNMGKRSLEYCGLLNVIEKVFEYCGPLMPCCKKTELNPAPAPAPASAPASPLNSGNSSESSDWVNQPIFDQPIFNQPIDSPRIPGVTVIDQVLNQEPAPAESGLPSILDSPPLNHSTWPYK